MYLPDRPRIAARSACSCWLTSSYVAPAAGCSTNAMKTAHAIRTAPRTGCSSAFETSLSANARS
eukprot:6197225-Pleurochrysis_carterae.AAC.2